ncbi:MAG: TonB-dependent receptor [Melioribacteraceae bacterium]|nr:TonB-dependent receptor [Melioribacteraceae bacterium]
MKKVLRYSFVLTISIILLASSKISFAQESGDNLLELDLEALLNIDVTTASKSAEKQTDAPGILSVLTKDDIARFGGTTLSDILVRVPGLNYSANYMTDKSVISARGDQIPTTSVHVLFLINGRPLREMLEGGVTSEMFETFPVNIIDRIEVIKGPGSVLYGSNAFSGVINIITEKAESTGINVSGLIGNSGATNVFGDVMVKSGDLSFVAAGKYSKKPEWDVNYSAGAPTGDIVTKSTTIPNEGSGIYVGANYKGLSFMGTYNQWETSYFVSNYMWLFEAFGTSEWKKLFGNIGYDAELTDNWNTSLNVSYTKSELDVSSWPGSLRNSNEIVGEWTNFLTLSSESKLIFGGLINKIEGTEKADGIADPISDDSRTNYAFYAQLDYNILDNLKAIGGVQLNKIENIDMNLVPRIGFIWSPASRFNVKALYGQAFRAPSLNETSIDFPAIQGTKDLKAEEISTFDLSVSYQGEQTQLSANYFYSTLSNMIYQDFSNGAYAVYMNFNTASTITGFELEGKYYVNRNLYLSGSTLYQSAEDENGNDDITPIANFGLKAGISYAWDDQASLSLFNVYQGDVKSSLKGSLNKEAGTYNLLYLHGKLNINKVFNLDLKPDFTLVVQVDNLLDEEVWLPNWGQEKGASAPFVQGRTIYAGLNLSL